MKTVLGIETSCDDTSICLLKGNPGNTDDFPQILSHKSFSSEEILKNWQGVVPEVAARNHLQKILPLLDYCFKESRLNPSDIDLLAVTTHPGLLGPLLTGLNAAKTLSLVLKKPLIEINHLFAHLEAIHIDQKPGYPYLGLLVSGGHGLYLWVKSPLDFKVIGTTIDDAPGEAFDKGGKLLGLPYPAGRYIDENAKKGDPSKFSFPIGLSHQKNANLSFSGTKTALRKFLEKNSIEKDTQDFYDVCASYQHSICQSLSQKLKQAINIVQKNFLLNQERSIPIVVGGGVANNSYLRQMLLGDFQNTYFVSPKFCCDNGAMIANYALRIFDQAKAYPECLQGDCRSRFIQKKEITFD